MIYIILWILFGVYNLYWVLYMCNFKLVKQETLEIYDLFLILISFTSGPSGTGAILLYKFPNITIFNSIKNPFYRGT